MCPHDNPFSCNPSSATLPSHQQTFLCAILTTTLPPQRRMGRVQMTPFFAPYLAQANL